MISRLLHLVGLGLRVYYTLANFSGRGQGPLAPPLNTPMYMGVPSDQFFRILYGAPQVSFFAYYMEPPSDQLLCIQYGAPGRSVFSVTIWGPLRLIYWHTIWGPPQTWFFFRLLYGCPPQVSLIAYYMGAPQISFFAYNMGAPQISFFACYYGDPSD